MSSRMVYRLDLAYEGTRYRGWARQPGLRTVQGTVEEALATVLRRPVRLSVAGRTDAGVHAWAQVASFVWEGAPLAPERVRLGVNALLPDDVVVLRLAPAGDDFVARRARGRTYEYHVWSGPVRPLRERRTVWHVRGRLDGAALAAAAGLLPGRRDFAALTPSARLYHTCEREVRLARWERLGATPDGEGERWRFLIAADSFLHMMVRVAVGSMVDVALGRMALEEFAAGLASGERRRLGRTAPACGLALVAVEY